MVFLPLKLSPRVAGWGAVDDWEDLINHSKEESIWPSACLITT